MAFGSGFSNDFAGTKLTKIKACLSYDGVEIVSAHTLKEG